MDWSGDYRLGCLFLSAQLVHTGYQCAVRAKHLTWTIWSCLHWHSIAIYRRLHLKNMFFVFVLTTLGDVTSPCILGCCLWGGTDWFIHWLARQNGNLPVGLKGRACNARIVLFRWMTNEAHAKMTVKSWLEVKEMFPLNAQMHADTLHFCHKDAACWGEFIWWNCGKEIAQFV